MKLQYPKPRRDESIKEELHGVTVTDPYRWMEDPDSEETKAFVDAQNKITKPFLEECPYREKLKETLSKYWNYPKYGTPFKRGDNYYYNYNSGLQNQYVMYTMKELNSEPEVFLDPNTLSEDGTISLSQSAFSEHGNFYAYSLSQSGSDWSTIYVKDIKNKKQLDDKLERFRYSSMSWTKDEKGFFYGQYPDWSGKVTGTEAQAVENQKIFYHRLGTDQSEDTLIVEFPDHPKWLMSPEVSDCGKYLIVNVGEGCTDSMVYVADISGGVTVKPEMKCIQDKFECEIDYITNTGRTFYFKTNKNRPNYAVVKIDLDNHTEWVDLIKESSDKILDSVSCVNEDKLVLFYLKDVCNVVEVASLDEGKHLQTLPFGVGTIAGFSGKKHQSETFFQFVSFTTPGDIYRCEIDKAPNATLDLHRKINLGELKTDGVITKQVFYESKDGTKIPMFITYDENIKFDGSNPCLLYGYGGFNISLQPAFSLFRLTLIKTMGFVSCLANLRGGGEYGLKWHKGGSLQNKQNTFDDLHCAAEYLTANKYTNKDKLCIMGGSNGGLLVCTSLNQRPDLYGAGVAQVPVADMYRFHKFTVGHAWCSDYGNPDVAEDFQVLCKYSPLHNIPSSITNYPNTLVLTADHDDRVVPSHSLKFIAELQHKLGETNENPLLTLVDTKAGHGAGKPTAKVIQELVDIMCFLYRALKAKYLQ